MFNEKEIQSMLYLLDDSDDRVVEQIEGSLMQLGSEIIPFLEDYWPNEENEIRQSRIVDLIKKIREESLVESLEKWLKSDDQDLLDGVLIINRIVKPNLDKQVIDNKLDKIKLDAWLELNYDLTSFEKIKILNHIFFDVHKFKGDTENYHHSKNSFLSSVLDSKQGNPISLAVIYSIVAQRLNIPVYGVNLPQHFILGYIKDLEWMPLKKLNDQSVLRDEAGSEIMFYINPFNSGLIFNRENILKFLKQLKVEPKDDFFKACSNKSILVRILRNLEVSFAKENSTAKLDQVRKLMKVLQRNSL